MADAQIRKLERAARAGDADARRRLDRERARRETVWPQSIEHEGRRWSWTGKRGQNVATGLPAAEYEDDAHRASRVWRLADGRVVPE